jgi:hypothetical protein
LPARHAEIPTLVGVCFGFLFQSVLAGQTPAHLDAPLRSGSSGQITEPAVPPDHLELVLGDAQLVTDPKDRADMVSLVTGARRHSNVRVQGYDLKTSFTAMGTGNSDGSWQMEDTSLGAGTYRWVAQGPGYSAVYLYLNKVLYSDHTTDTLPLRLAQVRGAIFFTQPGMVTRATIRRASGNLDGLELTCVLVAHNMMGRPVSGGRSWDEAEYCIDPKSNTMVTYSPIPGQYIRYDYANGVQFHETLVPARFTITQAGQTVIEARTVSVSDPVDDSARFQSTGLNTIGMGPAMNPPWHYHADAPVPSGIPADQPQLAIVHGMQSPKGRLSDIELIASSNPALNSSALQYASKWKARPMGAFAEPGTTPQSHEVFLTLQYLPPRQ